MDEGLPSWNLTLNDIEEIKSGNREVINRFYFDNIKHLKSCIYRVWSQFHFDEDIREWLYDCLHEIYLYLSTFDYSNKALFYWSIVWCVRKLVRGRSVHAKVFSSIEQEGEEKTNPLYFIAVTEDENDSDYLEELSPVVKLIEAQKALNDRQRDCLMAVALGCKSFDGIYLYVKEKLIKTAS